jgi:hypothetical protein
LYNIFVHFNPVFVGGGKGGINVFTPTKEDLVIPVMDAFWAYFFGSKLVIKFISGTVTFCLSCPEDRTQIMFVYNELGSSSVPTVLELANSFPCDSAGKELEDVRDLPVPMRALRNMTGVYLRKAELPDNRKLFVLYPTWEKESQHLHLSSKVLNAADFNLPPNELERIRRESPEHEVLMKRYVKIRKIGLVRLFTVLRRGSSVKISDKIRLVCLTDGQLDADLQRPN